MFNLSIITGLELCDRLIVEAQREVRRFAGRSQSLETSSTDTTERIEDFAQELEKSQNKLAETNANITNLPEGERKKTEIAIRMELETKIYKLELRSNKNSADIAVDKQYDKAIAEACLQVAQNYLAALEVRKGELTPPPPAS